MKKFLFLTAFALCNLFFTAHTCAQSLIVRHDYSNDRMLQFVQGEDNTWLANFVLQNPTNDELYISEIRFYFAPFIDGKEVTADSVGLFSYINNLTVCTPEGCGFSIDTNDLRHTNGFIIDANKTEYVSIYGDCDTGLYSLLAKQMIIAIEVDYEDENGDEFTSQRISSAGIHFIKPLLIEKNGLNQTLPAVTAYDQVIARGVVKNESSVSVDLKHMYAHLQGLVNGSDPAVNFARLVDVNGQTVGTANINNSPLTYLNFQITGVELAPGDSFAFTMRADILNPQDGDFLFCSMQTEGLIFNFQPLNGNWINSLTEVSSFLTQFQAPTGTLDLIGSTLSAYVYPVSDNLKVGSVKNHEVSIYSASGQQVMSVPVSVGSNMINIEQLSNGMYIAKMGDVKKKFMRL